MEDVLRSSETLVLKRRVSELERHLAVYIDMAAAAQQKLSASEDKFVVQLKILQQLILRGDITDPSVLQSEIEQHLAQYKYNAYQKALEMAEQARLQYKNEFERQTRLLQYYIFPLYNDAYVQVSAAEYASDASTYVVYELQDDSCNYYVYASHDTASYANYTEDFAVNTHAGVQTEDDEFVQVCELNYQLQRQCDDAGRLTAQYTEQICNLSYQLEEQYHEFYRSIDQMRIAEAENVSRTREMLHQSATAFQQILADKNYQIWQLQEYLTLIPANALLYDVERSIQLINDVGAE